MLFTLRDDTDKRVMSFGAKNEEDAWKKIKQIGIRNQSNMFKLVKVG